MVFHMICVSASMHICVTFKTKHLRNIADNNTEESYQLAWRKKWYFMCKAYGIHLYYAYAFISVSPFLFLLVIVFTIHYKVLCCI